MIESNHVVLWNRCLDVIKDNVPETTYNTVCPIVPLKYEDKTLILIPSQFFYEILEERFVDLIRKTLWRRHWRRNQVDVQCHGDKTSIPNQTVNPFEEATFYGCYSQKHNRGNKAPVASYRLLPFRIWTRI